MPGQPLHALETTMLFRRYMKWVFPFLRYFFHIIKDTFYAQVRLDEIIYPCVYGNRNTGQPFRLFLPMTSIFSICMRTLNLSFLTNEPSRHLKLSKRVSPFLTFVSYSVKRRFTILFLLDPTHLSHGLYF